MSFLDIFRNIFGGGKEPSRSAIVTASVAGSTFTAGLTGSGEGVSMANVTVRWAANAEAELVKSYKVYQDNVVAGTVDAPAVEYTVASVTAGAHTYAVAAVNELGEGPKSDSVSVMIPTGLPSKVTRVTVSVALS